MSYRRGRSFEYRVRDRLEREGYIVFRTSKSSGRSKGGVDLVAIRNGSVVLVECKTSKGQVTSYLKQSLKELAEVAGCRVLVYVKESEEWRKDKKPFLEILP